MTLGFPSIPYCHNEELRECDPDGYDTDVLESDSDSDDMFDTENTPANLRAPPPTMFAVSDVSSSDSRRTLWRTSVKNRDRQPRIRYAHRSSDRIMVRATALRESASAVGTSSSLRRSDPASLTRRSFSVHTSFSGLSLNSPVREEPPSTPDINRRFVFPAQEATLPPPRSHERTKKSSSPAFKIRSRSLMNLNADSSPPPDMPLPSFPLHESAPTPCDDFMPAPFPVPEEKAVEEKQNERRRALTQSASVICRPVMRAVSDKSPGRVVNANGTYSPLPSSYRHAGGMIAEYDMYNLPYPPVLPLLKKKKQSDLISAETVVGLMRGDFEHVFDSYHIIDCRYQYEYEGGHIRGARSMVPVDAEQELDRLFLRNPQGGSRVAIVFHCEFSSKRGPRACELLRKMDRLANRPDYPNLFFPYVYVMEGGYEKFHQAYPEWCEGGYLPMKDKKYSDQLSWNKRQERKAKSRSSSAVFVRPRCLTRSAHSQSFSHFRP